MSELLERLIEDAKSLSAAERATLVDNLLQEPGDPEWESAWLAECERRMTSVEEPDATPVAWESVRRHVFGR